MAYNVEAEYNGQKITLYLDVWSPLPLTPEPYTKKIEKKITLNGMPISNNPETITKILAEIDKQAQVK